MSTFRSILLGTLIVLALGAAVAVQAAVQYDAILEWDGPHFRVINAPGINQLTNDPVADIPFIQPFGVAAREHAAANLRDVVYVLDSGNKRIQAFETNAGFFYTDQTAFTFQAGGVAAALDWDTDQIYLAQWAAASAQWIVPRSEVVVVDGATWTWVADLTGFTAVNKVYTVDYDDAANAPEIVFPASSLSATSVFQLQYLLSDDQTGAAAAFGIGDVDYGTGAGAAPVLTQINQASGGPTSWQQIRALCLIQNEVAATSDDIFVVDAADNSGAQNEELFEFTVTDAGAVSFVEAYDDVLSGPYDVAVARSGASTAAALGALPAAWTAGSITDASQITGHSYRTAVAAGSAIISDLTTGKVIVTSTAWANLASPFLGIPGVSLTPAGAAPANGNYDFTTTAAVSNRYLFVTDTGGDRVKVIAAGDGAGAAWPGDWLPGDAHTSSAQPAAAGTVGATADVDYYTTTPATVPEDWTTWTNAYPIKEGTLAAVTFDPAGTPVTWTRVDDITTAGPAATVYQLDWTSGQILFGDGVHGLIPPASTAFSYTYSTSVDLLRYGTTGSGNGRFAGPKGVAARWNSSLGVYDVYVGDTGNNRMQKLAFVPPDLALNIPGRVEYVTQWNEAANGSDLLSGPSDVVVSVDNSSPVVVYVAVADAGNDRVVLFRDTAAVSGGGTTAPGFDATVGGLGNTLGLYTEVDGIALLPNGNDLDIYVADGQRGVVTKYEESPTPTLTLNFTGVSLLPACFPPTGSYVFTIVSTNPPNGGWIDFYYDSAPSFNPATAKLCFTAGSIPATATTATWVFSQSPGGAPANGEYYLFAQMKNPSGLTVATDQTQDSELLCIDSSLLPALRANDAYDGDRTLSMQNDLDRVIDLVLVFPDSIIATGYSGTFDPALMEITGITEGTAWDGTGYTNLIFNSTFNNTTGTYQVNSSVTGAPVGLFGSGPYVVAKVAVKAKSNAIDLTNRFKNSSFAIDKANSGMTDVEGASPASWKTRSLDARFGYLGDLATTGTGADSLVPNQMPKPDGRINFADQMVFTLGWNGKNSIQDPISDIGPISGTAPDVLSSPDGDWNVDDILAFTIMYSWASAGGFTRPAPGGAQDEFAVRHVYGVSPDPLGEPVVGEPFVYTISHVDNPLPGSEMTVDLVVDSAEDLTGALLNLTFDPAQLEPVQIRSGDFLPGEDGVLFFQRAGAGWLEVSASRLDRVHPGANGSGVLAQIVFKIHDSASSEFGLDYDLRSSTNEVMSRGTAKTDPLSGQSTSFGLYSSYPNPVHAGSNIIFSLPGATDVALNVYDSGGRLVRNLVSGGMTPGYHVVRFDGLDDKGTVLPAGVYFYRLQASDQISTRKLIVAR